jgi:hypothetical protein
MIVTFIDTAVAPVGIVQLPFAPHTVATNVSLAPTGVDLGPAVSGAGRVSIKRHGVIGTNDDAPGEPDADDVNTPPAPTTIANDAPNATQRDRDPTERIMTDLPAQDIPSGSVWTPDPDPTPTSNGRRRKAEGG